MIGTWALALPPNLRLPPRRNWAPAYPPPLRPPLFSPGPPLLAGTDQLREEGTDLGLAWGRSRRRQTPSPSLCGSFGIEAGVMRSPPEPANPAELRSSVAVSWESRY